MHVTWTQDEDGNGWTGEAKFWDDGGTCILPIHSIHLRQAMPLGAIYVAVDENAAGGWAMTTFDGAGLTERDLQWAAAWAVEPLKRKRELARKFST
jgi:hypothetical protein